MGSYADYKKRKGEISQSTEVSSPQQKSSYQRYKERQRAANPGYSVDTEYQSLIEDYKTFAAAAQADSENVGYGNAKSYLTGRSDAAKNLRDRANKLYSYMYFNRDMLDTKAYEAAVGGIEAIEKDVGRTMDFFGDRARYFSQWDTEDDYNAFATEQKAYEDQLHLDTDAAAKEIAQLESYLKDYDNLTRWAQDEAGQQRENEYRSKYGSVQDLRGLIEQKRQYLEQAKNYQKFAAKNKAYTALMDAEDFAKMSKYVPQERKEQRALDTLLGNYSNEASGWDDPLYEYINGNRDAGAYLANQASANYGGEGLAGIFGRASDSKAESQRMTKDEVAIFNYIYATQGKEAAHSYYYDHLQSELNARQREYDTNYWANYAKEHPFGSSVFSVITSPLKGLSYLGQAADYIATGKIDQNAGYNQFSYTNSAIRNQVSQQMENSGKWGKVGSFLYQTGMSLGDFVMSTAVSGGNQTFALAIMGTGSAADTTIAAKDRGLSDGQAFALGTIAGAAEVLMEKVSLDTLFDADLLANGTLKYVLKNALAEGGEEVGTDLINTLADVLIAQDKSQWQMAIDAYMAEGKSESEAFGLALGNKALELGLSGLGGALSGGVMSGSGAMIGHVQGNSQTKQLYGASQQELVTEALEIDPENAFAKKMQAKLDAGKDLSGSELNKLMQQNEAAINAQDARTGDPSTQQTASPSDRGRRPGWNPFKKKNTAQTAENNVFSEALDLWNDGTLTDVQWYTLNNTLRNSGAEAASAQLQEIMAQNRIDQPQGDVSAQPSYDVNDLVDEAIARAHNAPADPVSAALEGFQSTGTVTNSQARDILNNGRAVTQLIQQTGIKLPDTASGRRAAVKEAVAQMAQQSTEPIDTAQNTDYDNKNDTGGTTYAQTGTDNTHSARPLGANNEFAGVQAESRGASFEDIRQQSLYTDENETVRTRLSAALAGELERRGYRHGNADGLHLNSGRGQTFEVLTVDANTFHDIFEVARKYTRNGELVDLHSVKTTEDGIGYEECENYLSADGMSGFCITPDGDLISVFNADASKKGFLRAIAPVVKSKVKTLDCYMSQQQPLHEIYEKVFGMKVASVMDHNMDYDHDGIAANHNNPKVAFMVNSDKAVEPAFFGKDDYDAAKAYRDNLTDQHSNNQSSGAAPTESVGAAPGWFDPNTRLQYEHGTIPEGENPVRPDDLPKRDYVGGKVSYTARTVKGAKATPDSFVDLLNKEVTEGSLSYVPITNSATVQKAMEYIENVGWDDALSEWRNNVQNGRTGADLSAIGALLLNNAARAEDAKAWRDILLDYRLLGTNTAQGMQALRILKTLEPSDKFYGIERSIAQMIKDMHLDAKIEIDPVLETQYLNAKNEAERDQVLDEIQQCVADQLPATWIEKWNALRYVNMLGNFRTQGRNIAGNTAMKLVNTAKNAVATGIEATVSKASGGKFRRTKSLSVSKELFTAAKSDFANMESVISTGGKYSDSPGRSTDFARGVQDKRQIFKFKPLEGYRKATNWAMEQGDLIFSKSAYARALAGYLKANGVSSGDLSSVDTALLDDARLYAIKEAQEVTFRDSNWLSDWVSKAGRRKDTPAIGQVISEGSVPFRKTPANVLIRAEEYSPLGVINSLALSAQKIASETSLVQSDGLIGKFARAGEQISGAQIVNSWAKTLTGTGLFGLGMLMNSLGCLSAGPGDDEREDDFEALNGWQNYAVTLPGGINFTIDFATPSAIPMLMGAELMQQISDGGFQLKDIESALTSITEPMVQMSMLQGVNDVMENVRYSDNTVAQLLINSALSYLTQGLTNTLAGQLERTFEGSRMTTYVDKNSPLPAWLQRTLGKASAKTPFLDYNQIPYINAWGEEEENPEWFVNGVYNLLSPSYIEKGASTALTEELNRLNAAQSDVNVYPSAPDKTIAYSGEDHNLSAEKYVALAKAQGQTQKQLVEELISSADYATLSDTDKAHAIKYAYDYARDTARIEVLDDYPGYSSKWMERINGNVSEAILRHTAVGTTEKYADLPISTAAYVDDLLDGLKELPRETKADGTTYANVRDIQKMEAIVADDSLSKYVDDLLRDILDAGPEVKYDKALDAGYTAEQFVGGYRQYLDIEGENKKQSIIRYCQREMGMSYAAAKKLYEIYSSKTTDE